MKLNLGCGYKKIDGFVNIDSRRECSPDIFADVSILHFNENYIEEIYSSHFLEHFALTQARELLRRFNIWLQPSGKLYISVPDLTVVSKLISEGNDEYVLFNFLYGDEVEGMNHHWGYTKNTLIKEVEDNGFKFKETFKPFIKDDSSFEFKEMPLSLNLLFEKT